MGKTTQIVSVAEIYRGPLRIPKIRITRRNNDTDGWPYTTRQYSRYSVASWHRLKGVLIDLYREGLVHKRHDSVGEVWFVKGAS